MRRGLLATALLLLATPAAFSANTVKMPAGNLAIGKGEVSAKGTYSADRGWKAVAVKMTVFPPQGGLGGGRSGEGHCTSSFDVGGSHRQGFGGGCL